MFIIVYLVLALYTLLFFVAMCVLWALTAWWDGPRLALHRLSRVWARGYFMIVPGWRLRVEGAVDRRGVYVVVANHRSMIDIIVLYALPLRNFKWVSKREVYRWPLFGWVLWMHGDVTIEHGSAATVRRMIRGGAEWLRRGVSMVVFPEGTRLKGEGLGRFHDGAFRMAREAGVEVLPVVLTGSDTAFSRRGLNMRNDFTVRRLSPMEPEMDVVKEAMAEMARARAGQAFAWF
jgi:1-acyl-sn-glycerol-3-phosphate acyltransferase